MFKFKLGATLVISGLLLLSSCTRYANEQELKQLKDTQMAARKAESTLIDLKNDKKSLNDKLSESNKSLSEAKEEKSTVKNRLQKTDNEK